MREVHNVVNGQVAAAQGLPSILIIRAPERSSATHRCRVS